MAKNKNATRSARSTPASPPISPTSPAKPRDLTPNALVAVEAPHSQKVAIDFTFTSGIGQATAVLFRNGVLINMQSISSTGSITFSEVQTSDVISVNGVCTGRSEVTVSTTTIPATPKVFKAGLIMANFLIK